MSQSNHAADALAYAASAFASKLASSVSPRKPLDPDIVDEFDALLIALDLGEITRVGWDRLKELLAVAIVEGQDDDAGLRGYLNIAPKWRKSAHYDGRA